MYNLTPSPTTTTTTTYSMSAAALSALGVRAQGAGIMNSSAESTSERKLRGWLHAYPLAMEWNIQQQQQKQQQLKLANMVPPGFDRQAQCRKGAEATHEPPQQQRRFFDRDMFGGRGLFAEMWPIGISLAVSGLLPVTFRPIRICFHPLRSTLAYCVAVTALVVWSGQRMMSDRLLILREEANSKQLQARFTSIISLVHAMGVVLLPIMWTELAYNGLLNQTLCSNLMDNLGYVRTARCRCAMALSWAMVAFSYVVSPVTAVLFLRIIANDGSHWSHLFIHNHVLLLLFGFCTLISGLFHCVKNFAFEFQKIVVEELSQPCPSAQRIVCFRRGWLQLRDLTQNLIWMPVATIFTLLYMLLMTTLGSYLCLVCFFEGQMYLGALMIVLGLYFVGMILIVCDSVHRAVFAVGINIQRPLEMHCGFSTGAAAMDEINLFREVVSSNAINVSAAGFWDINRASMSSLMAATVSYLIVLIQFRQVDTSTADNFGNRSMLETNTEGGMPLF